MDLDPTKMDWTRQIGEPTLWFERFQRYLQMGTKRSFNALYREELVKQGKPSYAVKSIPASWQRMSRRWEWESRAELYDQFVLEEAQEKYESDRRELLQAQIELSKAMMKKSKDMLDTPLHRRKVVDEDGKSTTIILPTQWNFGDATNLAQTGVKMGRQALQVGDEDNPNVARPGSSGASDKRPQHLKDFAWLKEFEGLSSPENTKPSESQSNKEKANAKPGNPA